MLQVLSFNPSAFCNRQLLTHPPLSSRPVCVCLCFSLLSSLFPPAWVNVRASCCSSQTTPWETDQPHRRGNPLFWLKEKGKGREERNFYASKAPLVSSSPLVLVHCTQPWTMWPSSQAFLRLERRKRGGPQLPRRWWGISKSQLEFKIRHCWNISRTAVGCCSLINIA